MLEPGSYFCGSTHQRQGAFAADFHLMWLPQFFYALLLEPSVHWHDAGMFGRYAMQLVAKGQSVFGTSWLEEGLRCRCIVPRLRDDCSSFRDVHETLTRGRFSEIVDRSDRAALAARYDRLQETEGIVTKPWNAGCGRQVVFGESLLARLVTWFDQTERPQDLVLRDTSLVEDVDNLWHYVRDQGRRAFDLSLERTERLQHRGFRISDFDWAMHRVCFGAEPGTDPVDMESIRELLVESNHPDASYAIELFHLISDHYDINFAQHTTGKRYALVVDPGRRTLTLGAPWTNHRECEPETTRMLGSISLPTATDLWQTNPSRLKAIRDCGEVYFARLADWNRGTGNLETVAVALEAYARDACNLVDSKASRPLLRLCSVGVGGGLGGLASTLLTVVPGPIGTIAGASAGAIVGEAFCLVSDLRNRPGSSWAVESFVASTK